MATSGIIGEAILEAWIDLKPQGFTVQMEAVVAKIELIISHLLGCIPTHKRTESIQARADQMLENNGGAFLALLHPHSGQVNFLDYWNACGKASRSIEASSCHGLFEELEALRDQVLRQLDVSPLAVTLGYRPTGVTSSGVPASLLLEELDKAAASSARPEYWRAAIVTLDAFKTLTWFNIHQLTNVFMSWLYEASLWERTKSGPPKVGQRPGDGPICAPLPLEVLRCAHNNKEISVALARLRTAPPPPRTGIPVYLHIYDATQEETVQWFNTVLAHAFAPVKLGGAFHAGVEVNGLEWSFGLESSSTRYGLWCTAPKKHPKHHYRETLARGCTKLAATEIVCIIAALLEEYPGEDYDVLTRNCCHFAHDFLQRLGVEGVPNWVQRFANMGAHIESMLPKSMKDQIFDLVDPLAKPIKEPLEPRYQEPAVNGLQWDPLRATISDAHVAY